MVRLAAMALTLAAAPASLQAQDMPSDPILRTFVEGDAAGATGDYAGLLDAAQMLNAMGATPAEGQEDVASEWTQRAHDKGVTRSRLGARGRALGPAYRRGWLPAGGSFATQQLFLGGQKAQIAVAAPGAIGSLHLQVTGTDGTILCERAISAVQSDCNWRPDYTSRVDILIENRGQADARFYLLMR